MKEKKLKQSPIVLILYLLGALMMVYTIYQIISTCSAISSYYSQMGSAPKATEIINYVLQAIVQPIASAALLGGAGYILNEVRALNPKNYITVEKPAPVTEEVISNAEEKPATEKEAVTTTKKVEMPEKAATSEKPVAKETAIVAEKPVAKEATATTETPDSKETPAEAKKPVAKKADATEKSASTAKKPATTKAATTTKKSATSTTKKTTTAKKPETKKEEK